MLGGLAEADSLPKWGIPIPINVGGEVAVGTGARGSAPPLQEG